MAAHLHLMIITAFVSLTLLLVFLWKGQLGLGRALLAGCCRLAWVLPLLLAFFPETTAQKLPKTLSVQKIQVLEDDSKSMQNWSRPARQVLEKLTATCQNLGTCEIEISRLSQLDRKVREGYSPLNAALSAWLQKHHSSPWVFLSDGGDMQPSLPWDEKWRGVGVGSNQQITAQIVGFRQADVKNIWVTHVDASPFFFQDKPITLSATLKRSYQAPSRERFQVQLVNDDKALGSINLEFEAKEMEQEFSITVPNLEKGQHLLAIKALPIAGESALWDNMQIVPVEVLPNTVGVLHLLGAPSFDGRFLRRFFKSEPKYDLISFFILRDPWDSQEVSERELSLIPFPVERLFNEELANFRVVVVQNFALFQFLQPEYQNNLVEFVKNGGGLLFLGGPRALQAGDFGSSALAEIIPFENPKGSGASNNLPSLFSRQFGATADKNSPYYDPQLKFKIELAAPSSAKRMYANLYDDWEEMRTEFLPFSHGQGIHRMDQVKFREQNSTVLLHAKLPDGNKIPLAVASYPGKGRALWLFSDSFWRLALDEDAKISRQSYNRFFSVAMNWLMRQELKRPLVVKNFLLRQLDKETVQWSADISGPAARYFDPQGDWLLSVCNRAVAGDKSPYSSEKHTNDSWHLRGSFRYQPRFGERCGFVIKGNHAAFGSVSSQSFAVFPEIFNDEQNVASANKLEELSRLTGAELVFAGEDKDVSAHLAGWLEKTVNKEGVALPDRFKSVQNHYWVLDRYWFFLLLLFIPLEVLIRRWHLLFA